MKKFFPHKYIISLLAAMVILSCSTEKNTFVNRNFHNLTAHYNVYFNGNEAMKIGLEKIETRVEEDYTKILPVFKESLPGTETMVTSDMNIAVEKGMKLIKLHSITKAPEANRKQKNSRKRKEVKPEYNKWVDDAYIMMGRAYLYQKDYIRASSTFLQIIRKYKDEPVKYNAYLWLVRTYSESERYTEARELIETLDGNDQFPEKLEGELAIVAADLHLKQQHYDEAIQYLNIGIKKIKGNKRKTRYSFILAQLYQELGNKEKALEAYHQVIRRRPDYTMLFNAQINSASVYSGEGDVTTLRKELNKMRKKKRNAIYLDQIYYALGNILYNEGKTDDAIDYYKQSAAVSVKNTYQRALSCLTLADIYFERRAYIPSGGYYDSAMVIIDENYPNYDAINEKHKSLSNLVTNLLEVQTQDSLQYLAGLSKDELNAKIDKWITVEKQRLEAEAEEDLEGGAGSEYDMAYGRSSSNRMRVNNGSSWYYYNPSTVAYGKKEFQRLWGGRKNQDDWRRSDKSISELDESGQPIADDLSELIEEETNQRAEDSTTPEYYLQDIPGNDSLMAVSHDKIRDALFNAGNIFKTDFNDIERSIECFRELNRRYPNNIYELPSYFSLWDLYANTEKKDSSTYFKNEILSEYPNSNYAKYLINPNYFIEEEARKDSLNRLYAQAFNAYKAKDYKNALAYSKMVEKMNPDSTLMPKVKFIETVAANSNNQKQLAKAIEAYLKEYPSDEIAALAKQIFDLVKEEKLTNYQELVNTGYLNEVIKNLELVSQTGNSEDPLASKWDSDTELLHYFVIAVPNDEKININRLKFDIANYNIDHYTTLDFDIETESLNSDTKLIIVRNFNDKESALIYFLSIIRKPQVFKTLAGIKFLNFIISNNNFREMLGDRNYTEYLKFFVKNYSSFTSGDFNDEDLESPEELMARLKQENNEFKERGEYVLLDTDNGSYQAPEPKEQIFKLDYSAPHSLMIMIKEPRYRTGFLMRDMVRYNSDKHRTDRLRVIPVNMTETTLLLISSFGDAYTASQYQKEITENKELLQSVKDVQYETFIISDENLNKLKETNNLKEWDFFYRNNFIYRKPPAPVQPKEEKPIEVPVEQPKPEVKQETSKQVDTPADKSVEIATEQVEIATEQVEVKPTETKQETETTESNEVKAEETSTTSTETVVAEEPKHGTGTVLPEPKTEAPTYSGSFKFDAEAMHNIVYLLPSSGSNKTLLTTYIARFNAMKYRSFGLQVSTEEFDDFRSSVIIAAIGNKEKAQAYFVDVNADSRVSMSLRNVNYKAYLITNENLEILKSSKDITEYQKFYDAFYK